jgi:bifunctional DNase/RNase
MTGQITPRPLTHDLYMLTLQAFGAQVSRVVINAIDGDVFYARLILTAENEIMANFAGISADLGRERRTTAAA